MPQSIPTDDPPAGNNGEDLQGESRKKWLDSLLDRMLRGVITPASAAKIPLRVWREAGVPESILNDYGLTGLESGDDLPPRCSMSTFQKIVLEQLGLKIDRGNMSRDFTEGFAMSARNEKSHLVETIAALNLYRSKYGDQRNNNGGSVPTAGDHGGKSASELDREFKETRNEDARIDLENKRRMMDAKWIFRTVFLETAASWGVVTKSVARDILEKQAGRPDLFDAFQKELENRLAELNTQCEKENRAQKAEEQRKLDAR